MMTKSHNIKDRLSTASMLLKDCKVLSKNGEFKLCQDKIKPEILNNIDNL